MTNSILVIDDSPTILKVVELVLIKKGYKVRTAHDGDEGIAEAKRERPDLILLDFVMPRMNGYQVCRALHETKELQDIPVILMSAKGDQVGSRFVKVMGVVDYITKPFSPEAIVGLVEHTLAKYQGKVVVDRDSEALLDTVAPEVVIGEANAVREARRQTMFRIQHELARTLSENSNALATVSMETVKQWALDTITLERLEVVIGELRASAPELAGVQSAALTGDLSAVTLGEVLLLLQHQAQTGTFAVRRGDVQVDLYFHKGNIELGMSNGMPEEFLLGRYIVEQKLMPEQELQTILKSREGGSRLLGTQLVKLGYLDATDLKRVMRQQTCELIYEMLRWNFGKFAFRASQELDSIAAEAALDLAPDSILMEGYRRVDEWHLIEREVDNFDLVFVRNDDAVSALGRGKLNRDELTVLELANGKNTVKDIVRQSKMGSFAVSQILYRLLSVKLIRKRVAPVAV